MPAKFCERSVNNQITRSPRARNTERGPVGAWQRPCWDQEQAQSSLHNATAFPPCDRHRCLLMDKTKLRPQTVLRSHPALVSSSGQRGPHDDSVSFHFNKLALKFLRVRADDKKSAMCEPSRDYTRKIGVRGMGRGWQHRAHYIG